MQKKIITRVKAPTPEGGNPKSIKSISQVLFISKSIITKMGINNAGHCTS